MATKSRDPQPEDYRLRRPVIQREVFPERESGPPDLFWAVVKSTVPLAAAVMLIVAVGYTAFSNKKAMTEIIGLKDDMRELRGRLSGKTNLIADSQGQVLAQLDQLNRKIAIVEDALGLPKGVPAASAEQPSGVLARLNVRVDAIEEQIKAVRVQLGINADGTPLSEPDKKSFTSQILGLEQEIRNAEIGNGAAASSTRDQLKALNGWAARFSKNAKPELQFASPPP